MGYNVPVIYVVDYGAGNIRSVLNSLSYLGARARLAHCPADLARASGVVVPGVGSFGAAMASMKASGLDRAITDAAGRGLPVMGICLGLQLFLGESEESPGVGGLGLIPGVVTRLKSGNAKLPHIGWTSLDSARGTAAGTAGEFFYFVHSFGAHTDERYAAASATYGETFAAAIERDNVFAVQFHPEKSGKAGLELLARFVGRVKE